MVQRSPRDTIAKPPLYMLSLIPFFSVQKNESLKFFIEINILPFFPNSPSHNTSKKNQWRLHE